MISNSNLAAEPIKGGGGFANGMLNVIRDNYGNSSNDTGPDTNLVGHILTREQADELEKAAISKAN